MFAWPWNRKRNVPDTWTDRVITPAAEVVIARQDGRSVLLDLRRERYWGLDETGTRIWELVSAGIPFSRIVDSLEDEYAEPRERLESDARAFLTTLLKTRLAVMA